MKLFVRGSWTVTIYPSVKYLAIGFSGGLTRKTLCMLYTS